MNNLIIEFLASFLIWFMLVGLFVLYATDGKIRKEGVLHGLFAFALAWVIADIIKHFFPTLRPFAVNGLRSLVFFPEKNGAFPSGHTASAFALAVTIWFHDKKFGWIYVILAISVGVARVLANVHYPVDILGGAILGILVGLAMEKVHLFDLVSKIKRKGT